MILFDLFISLAECYIILDFIGCFLKAKPLPQYIKFVSLVCSALILWILYLIHITWANTIFLLIMLAFLSHIWYEGSLQTTLVLAIFAVGVFTLCEYMVLYLVSFFMQNSLDATISYSFSLFIVAAISVVLFFIITEVMRGLVHHSRGEQQYKLHLMLLLPISTIFTLYFMLYNDKWIPHTGLYSFLCSILCIVLIVVNIVQFYAYNQQQKTYELKMELFATQKHQEEQELIVAQQKEHIDDLAALSHDFKNHLLTIESMLVDNPLQAQSYIENLTGTVLEHYQHVKAFTNNTALNSILNYYKVECEKEGIELIFDINYPNFEYMDYADVCAIFGNALDNAITACKLMSLEESPYIKIFTSSQSRMISICIVNSISNTQKIMSTDDDQFLTTKEPSLTHGYGLANIKNAVMRYDGTAVFNASPTEFQVTIIIPTPD